MDVKICDRCGKEIEGPYHLINTVNLMLLTKSEVFDICSNCYEVFEKSFMHPDFVPESECELFQYSSIGSEGIEHCHGWCEKCRSIMNCGGLKKHCKVGESNDEQQTKN